MAGDAAAKMPAPLADSLPCRQGQAPRELVSDSLGLGISRVAYKNHLITVDLAGRYGWKLELKNAKTGKATNWEFGRKRRLTSQVLPQPVRAFVLERSDTSQLLIVPRNYLPMDDQFVVVDFKKGAEPAVRPEILPLTALDRVTNVPLAFVEKGGNLYFFVWSSTLAISPTVTVSVYDAGKCIALGRGEYEGDAFLDELGGEAMNGGLRKTITVGDSGFTVSGESGARTFRFNVWEKPFWEKDTSR